MEENKNVKASSPWVSYYHKLNALFGRDPDIMIEYDEDEYNVEMYIKNPVKADALERLLPKEVPFGNVTLHITLIPANGEADMEATLRAAFDRNPVLNDIIRIDGAFSNPLTYLMFAKEVAQFFDDNLGDPHGNVSTLYQDIAKEIIGSKDGVFYCTDVY